MLVQYKLAGRAGVEPAISNNVHSKRQVYAPREGLRAWRGELQYEPRWVLHWPTGFTCQ